MADEFPKVAIIGEGPLISMLDAPALALGVEIVKVQFPFDFDSLARCSVASVIGGLPPLPQLRTFESAGALFRPNLAAMTFVSEWNEKLRDQDLVDGVFSVMVALSPHDQVSAWTPTEIIQAHSTTTTITPSPKLGHGALGIAQGLALDLVKESNVTGVIEIEIALRNGNLMPRHLSLGPSFNGLWTMEGARTSQFEQHLRAILDLPLGDPSLLAANVVTGNYCGEGNMYRPYLHLMARSPAMKIHQYRSGPGPIKGHVMAMGGDLLDLSECVTHAVDYMSGVIDE